MGGKEYWSMVVEAEGYRSLREWAHSLNFKPGTVYFAIREWGNREEEPHGGLNRQIMKALREAEAKHAA